jgi:hypothetical protein
MRNLEFLVVALALLAMPAFAADNEAEGRLDGAWRLEERHSVVRFTSTDGGWVGVIEASERPKEVGLVLLRSLRPVRSNKLRGTLVTPENGSTHDAVVTVTADEAKVVIGSFIFTKTLELKRVK